MQNDELKVAMMFDKVYNGLCAGKAYRRRSWTYMDSITREWDGEWYFMASMKDRRYDRMLYELSADDIFATDWEEVV